MRDAVGAWLEAKRALDQAMPWTADWLRLRMIEQDRRAAYLALMDRKADEEDGAGVDANRRPETVARPDGAR